MPSQTRGRGPAQAPRPPQTAVQTANTPSQALVAVTREIDNRLAIIRASGAAGIDENRLKLVALTTFTRTPALMDCEPVSVARAIVEAGQLGLEPTGLLGGAYLVPRAGKATLLVGYRGLVMLAKRSGEVQRVEARVVREKDQFEYGYGLDPYLRHVPSTELDPGPYTGAYAVLFYRDGSKQFDYMSAAEIEAIRRRSSSPTAGPWVTDAAEMWKKTPLRRLMKMAPLTIQVASKLDELDPETDDASSQPPVGSRQAELRQELQAALEREYGTSPDAPRQLAAGATTQPAAPGGGGQARASAEDEQGSSGAPVGAQAPAAAVPPTAAAGPEPEAAKDVPPKEMPRCGLVYDRLGVGPCVLPEGHEAAEHEEAGGTRWTMPRAAAAR